MLQSNKKAIIINDRHEVFKKLIKKDREALEEILVCFKIAESNSKGDVKKLEELFFEGLKEWRR